ncbi:uncharacterized protein LOC123314522 [Coccinella septempunctata]|uniref:uncharacterized protein LOC123314522 n=1 Tax=Coccinella septempunctata TaxID=41139 RepID=UPI001D07B80C|nr:uncharacterized protein LOC123314522 [Coccinella septempunctata]
MLKEAISFLFITFAINSCIVEVHGLVCPENVCENLQCENMDQNLCSGPDKLIAKGGFCDCCDTCFSIAGVGEYCGFPLYGLPPSSILCKEGLSCVGGFCVPRNRI